MSMSRPHYTDTPLILCHSLDDQVPDLPSSLRVYLCDSPEDLVDSWMDCNGVILLHASAYSERLLSTQEYLTQNAPDAAVVVLLSLPDLRSRQLIEAGVQEIIMHSADVSQAVSVAQLRKRRECDLQSYLYLDTLTQLSNRQLFLDRLEHSLEQHKRQRRELALVLIDMDRFFQINERYGHQGGDVVLQAVAARLKECTRKADTLARIGGNTFAVVAELLQHSNNAGLIAEKLARQFNSPFILGDEEVNLSVSIGAELATRVDFDSGDLLRHSEAALTEAKQMGRNSFMLYQCPRPEDRIRGGLETSLYHAIENNEIFMEYQPQVRMKDGVIVGFEALMRWQHPVMGPVSPGVFIPVLETTGLIEEFGMWGLRSACGQLSQWIRDGVVADDTRMSVNLSPRQFQHPTLVDDIMAALDESQLPATNLTLEITESLVIERDERIVESLRFLRAQGVHIAVDDFGTGYSSFAYLKMLPVDCLKIDRGFVQDIVDDARDRAIAESIIHLAHTLKIDVVAEGVEVAAAEAALLSMGCDHYQGFYFARPMRADAIPALMSGA